MPLCFLLIFSTFIVSVSEFSPFRSWDVYHRPAVLHVSHQLHSLAHSLCVHLHACVPEITTTAPLQASRRTIRKFVLKFSGVTQPLGFASSLVSWQRQQDEFSTFCSTNYLGNTHCRDCRYSVLRGVPYGSVSQPLWDRRPVNSFFIRRGPGRNTFTRKYLSNFFKFIIKGT